MKIRQNFVSNSSSTSFILDLRTPKVKELVERLKGEGIGLPYSYNRCTALAVKQDAVDYANEWIDGGDDGDFSELGPWILKHARTIGTENVVFVRESDEGMCGYLFVTSDTWYDNELQDLRREFKGLAIAEMEYH